MYNAWKYKAMDENDKLIQESGYLKGLGKASKIYTQWVSGVLVMFYFTIFGKIVGGWVFIVLFITLCFMLMRLWENKPYN